MRAPPFSAPPLLAAAFEHFSPAMLIRKTGYRLKPPRPTPFTPAIRRRQAQLLGAGLARLGDQATLLHEHRKGGIPTIVLGGFVPDATEQAFLVRGCFLRRGSVYYVSYPRGHFSVDCLLAQLDDLVEELATVHLQPPVVFAVSFGAGLVLEWLKRTRRTGRFADVRGFVLVSPVACTADVLEATARKPGTLLGRALKPFIDRPDEVDEAGFTKARSIFLKMFEAGAQNTKALTALMTRGELQGLRSAVMSAIQGLDREGAQERVRALASMTPLSAQDDAALLPLSHAPTLILFAEKESSVLVENSPTRSQLEAYHACFFPASQCQLVRSARGNPVQHASLIFHYFDFLPAIAAFYKTLKARTVAQAA